MEIKAKSVKELFEFALKGMNTILKKDYCNDYVISFKSKKQIEIHSQDYTSLLIDFLSDVLTNTYVSNVIYCEINIIELSENHIVAHILGSTSEEFDEEIKAVTYHEALVIKDSRDQLWKTSIIFDI